MLAAEAPPTKASASADPETWWRRTRIRVALLGLAISAVNCYAQATFCIAIVEMVLPADYTIRLEAGQTATISLRPANGTQNRAAGPALLADESCPLEYKYRDYYDAWRFPETLNLSDPRPAASGATSAAAGQPIDVSQRFAWDASQQGILLGAFAFGTAPLQVLGGRLAELYGSKWVLFAGCLGTALTNLTIPHLARFSYLLLVANRVLMGVAQAGMEPGLMCLLSEWLAPSETGFFISMLLFAICIGFFLGSLCSSFILALGYGWPLAYYVSGGLNLAVGALWAVYADSWPRHSRHISPGELKHVQREQNRLAAGDNLWPATGGCARAEPGTPPATTQLDLIAANEGKQNISSKQAPGGGAPQTVRPAPWLNILTTRSVWAFIVCKISIRWCADVFSNELPTYLANVLHLSIKFNGILNGVSSALLAIFSFATGWLVNELLARQCIGPHNKTALRKTFQSVASFGSALAVFLMTFYDCSIVLSMSMLLVVSCCLVMGTGGELQIPYDMTSRYPGTLHGMACTLSVSGWLAPPLIGVILGDQPSSRHRWSIVWYLTAAINLIGGLAFVLFADASPRDFDQLDKDAERATSVGPSAVKSNGQTGASGGKDDTEAGGRTTIATNWLSAYYNDACKPQDDSPPQNKRTGNPILGATSLVQTGLSHFQPSSSKRPASGSCDILFPFQAGPTLGKFDDSQPAEAKSSARPSELAAPSLRREPAGRRSLQCRKRPDGQLTRLLSSFAYGTDAPDEQAFGARRRGRRSRIGSERRWTITKEAPGGEANELQVPAGGKSGAPAGRPMEPRRDADGLLSESQPQPQPANRRTDVRHRSLPLESERRANGANRSLRERRQTGRAAGGGGSGGGANQLAAGRPAANNEPRGPPAASLVAAVGGGSGAASAAQVPPNARTITHL